MTHKIELFGSSSYGFDSRLVCPEDCEEKELHKDMWSDVGLDLVTASVDKVLVSFEVEPYWTGHGEDAEMWLKPVVDNGSES